MSIEPKTNPLTQQAAQREAMIIEHLLDIAMSMDECGNGGDDGECSDQVACILSIAHARSRGLNLALDSVNGRIAA